MAGLQSTNISFPSGVLAEYRWRYSFETDFIAVWVYLLSESHINAAIHFNTFCFTTSRHVHRLNILQK
jgi:hypothetical protein